MIQLLHKCALIGYWGYSQRRGSCWFKKWL